MWEGRIWEYDGGSEREGDGEEGSLRTIALQPQEPFCSAGCPGRRPIR